MALMAVFQAMGDEMPENFGVGYLRHRTEKRFAGPVPVPGRPDEHRPPLGLPSPREVVNNLPATPTCGTRAAVGGS
jgi:hypothetical protein